MLFEPYLEQMSIYFLDSCIFNRPINVVGGFVVGGSVTKEASPSNLFPFNSSFLDCDVENVNGIIFFMNLVFLSVSKTIIFIN